MKKILLLLFVLPLSAHAESICKSKDKDGRTVYSQGDCEKGTKTKIFPGRPTHEQFTESQQRAEKSHEKEQELNDKEREQQLLDKLKNSSIGALRANRMALEHFYHTREADKKSQQ